MYIENNFYHYGYHEKSTSTEINYVTFELQQLKIPFGIRYTLPERKLTPYLNAGVSATFHLSASSEWIQEVEWNTNVLNTYDKPQCEMKDRQLGLWGGLGILKDVSRKLQAGVELRYEKTDGITPPVVDSEGFKSRMTHFQVILSLKTK